MLRSRLTRIRALRASISRYAEDDPRTHETRLRLAEQFRDHQYDDADQQRWERLAAIEIERVIESRARTLGADHPLTLDARFLRVWTYQDWSPGTPAHDLLAELVAGRELALGLTHPDTLEVLRMARDPRYLAACERALASSGPDSVEAQSARLRIAGEHHDTGRRTEARELREQAVAGWGRIAAERARTLGPIHPETLIAREQHAELAAAFLDRQGEWTAELVEIAADHEREAGPDDPRTLRARVRLARHYGWNDPRGIALGEVLLEQASALADFEAVRELRYLLGVAYRMGGREADARTLWDRHPTPDDGDVDLVPGDPGYPETDDDI